MNVFNRVTLHSLKLNKTRTVVTIIGIMLSAAMICAVTTFLSSMQNYSLQYAVYNDGDWHGAVYDMDFRSYMEIQSDEEIAELTYAQVLGYAKIDSQSIYKPYLYVLGGENSFFKMLPVHLLSGRLPESTGEIILPEHLKEDGEIDYKLGDVITLELGERLLDGWAMGQNNPCYEYDSEKKEDVPNGEIIKVRESRTYTVVGFYERPSFEEYSASGFTALTVADSEFTADSSFDVYFKMKKPARVYDYVNEKKFEGTYNTDVLLYSGVSRYNTFFIMLFSLAAIVTGLIMFGSVSLIYNAFSISVSERTKQFGLLSSVGATRRQLKKMVLFEAMAVSAVGIPLGILVGIGGIGITLLIIGHRFTLLTGGSFDEPMRICVSWIAIAAAIGISLVTVLLSAWIPSKRATRVSAVEAIRQNMDIKAKDKPIRTSRLTYKLFGLPGVLASKYYKRNRKKYRTTIISLFMSIVLFISASAFTEYLMESVTGGISKEKYDLVYLLDEEKSLNGKDYDEFLELLMSEKYVTDGTYVSQGFYSGVISKEYLTEAFVERSLMLAAESVYDADNSRRINGYIYYVDDSKFDKLLEEQGLDRDEYYNYDRPLGIAVDNNVEFDEEKQRFTALSTLRGNTSEISCSVLRDSVDGYEYEGTDEKENGEAVCRYRNSENDVLELKYEEACLSFEIHTGKTINIADAPYYIPKSTLAHLMIIYPVSMMEYTLPKDDSVRKYFSCSFYLISDNHGASCDNLKTVLTENDYDCDNLIDYAEEVDTSRNLVTIIKVFAYGFTVLISLIAAANVFNTISTNVNLRRREFAMLKSTGMTAKGFNRMMNYECILYGSKALLLGLPVSAGVTWLIYKAFSSGYETQFHMPLTAVGVAVFSVFAVVFVTMVYSMSKIKKDNPIDALKNENL